MPWIKKAAPNVALVLVSLLLALTIGEVLVRAVAPYEPEIKRLDYWRPDPVLLGVFLPNSPIGTDANGFNNETVPEEADIVVLGDSHTYGRAKYAWPEGLAENNGVTVYNMGAPAYGPAQYYYYAEKALSFNPDVVVLGLYLGNDLWDAYNVVYNAEGDYWKAFQRPDFANDFSLHDDAADVRLKGMRDVLNKWSALYRLLGNETRLLREWLGLAKPRTIGTTDWSNNDPAIGVRYAEDNALETVFRSGDALRGLALEQENIQEGMKLTKMFLLRLNTKLEASGTELVIALFPTKETAYDSLVGARADKNEFYTTIVENEEAVKKELFTFCALQNIPCHDVVPAMQRELKAGNQMYPHTKDGHPTAAGYNIYAESIYRFLIKNDIL